MKRDRRNLNIEKETKENHSERKPASQIKVEDTLRSKKHNPESNEIQYPATVGYHGTDNEQDLSPEE